MINTPLLIMSLTKSLILLLFLFSMQVYASLPAPHDNDAEYKYKKPGEIILLFNKAVKNGELYIFDTLISLPMITPKNVEYVYELNSTSPVIKVYSILKTPIPVPDNTDYSVTAVTATITIDGRIIESAAHVQLPE